MSVRRQSQYRISTVKMALMLEDLLSTCIPTFSYTDPGARLGNQCEFLVARFENDCLQAPLVNQVDSASMIKHAFRSSLKAFST